MLPNPFTPQDTNCKQGYVQPHSGDLILPYGFSENRELQVLHASLFLLIYLATLMENLLIVTLICFDQCLHTPTYFFLKNLSLGDLCLSSILVPKSILNSLSNRSAISFLCCFLQVLLVIHFAGPEFFILTTISYDHYVAICQPLHYYIIMSRGVCVKMASSFWFFGGFFSSLNSAAIFSLSFCCYRKFLQFFCDVPSLLRISFSKAHITVDISVAIGIFCGIFCLPAIVFSYSCIFSIVLSIPSVQGWSKSFSTCLSHFIIVTTYFLTGATAYLKPVPEFPTFLDLLLSVLYSVVPPTLNPIIYSLRNKGIKAALRKLLWKLCCNKK